MVPAMARQDAAETARLFATAPRLHYQVADLEFLRGMRAVERMGLHAALAICRETAHWLLCLSAVGHGLAPEGDLDAGKLEQIQANGKAALQAAKASWQAYVEAVEALGVDPHEAMRALGVPVDDATLRTVKESPVDPCPATLKAMRELMAVIVGDAW
jgi:hypothetical protein